MADEKKIKGPDFLVVGLQRSGTHWITALLNAHPEISCFPAMAFQKENGEHSDIGEIHLFNTLASLEPDSEGKFTRPLENYLTQQNKIFADLVPYKERVSKEELYQMFIERYNELCDSRRGDKKIVGENTPAYVFHLNFIDSFYPGIKKICIIRDSKDRIVSWHFNLVRKGRKTKDEKITDEFVRDYCEKTIIREYEILLEYSGNIYCLAYESMSADPQKAAKGILKYLEIGADDEMIRKMVEEASFKNLNAKDSGREGREKGQESINSHYRKGVVGDWKNHLTKEQALMADNIVSELSKKVFNKFNL